MGTFLVKRLIFALLVLLTVLTTTFLLIQVAPGGPVILMSQELTGDQRRAMRAKLGLDDPLPVQYLKWMTASLRGDFGISYTDGRPVTEHIRESLPRSLLLGLSALVLASVAALIFGMIAAVKVNTWLDHAITTLTSLGLSIPSFWAAILLILLLAVWLRWLPSAGMTNLDGSSSLSDVIRHMIMPVTVLSIFPMAELTRFTRSSVLEVLRKDYIRTARAKGLHERYVLTVHALKNALIPVLTLFGLVVPNLVGGQVIVEVIFGWPGRGRLNMEAIGNRDYGMIMAITTLSAVLVILTNIMVDVLYGILDPRIRVEA
jgi:peptide/nickel transport system permease protein